jgi:hypothetical protein
MRTLTTCVATMVALQLGAAEALAQRWSSIPSRGACFYEDANYRGNYFCFPMGQDVGVIPAETNDQISSIRLFGPVEIVVYKDGQFRGPSHRFTSSISNLGTTGWNDRISSFRIEERRVGSGNWGGSGWGGGGGGAYGGGGWGNSHSSGGGGWGGGYGGAYGGGSYGGWGSGGSSRLTYQQAQQIVERAYQRTLGRSPDPSGWNYWANEVMKRNMSQAQLEAELRNSDEYRERRR